MKASVFYQAIVEEGRLREAQEMVLRVEGGSSALLMTKPKCGSDRSRILAVWNEWQSGSRKLRTGRNSWPSSDRGIAPSTEGTPRRLSNSG